MKTQSVKQSDIVKEWFVIDAEGLPLGRLATQVAHVLRGKHKSSYVRHLDCGDNVVVINADKVKLTGRKASQKFYYRYTNYIGGLKSTRADDMLAQHPDRVITAAVKGMLPHNKLGRRVLKNLKVVSGADHGHQAQKPVAMPSRLAGKGE